MSALLTSHLEQISLCATSISELQFPGPRMFTNALLSPNHDITALIRDTEAHERALFHLAAPQLPAKASDFAASVSGGKPSLGASTANRRATTYNTAAASRQSRSRAVAAVLGGDLYAKTRRPDDGGAGSRNRQKGDLDVEVLLEGAERLAAVYPITGAADKITQLRRRHQQLMDNIAHYEDRVSRNTQELQFMSARPASRASQNAEDDDGPIQEDAAAFATLTKEDLARELEEVRELERKRKGLESRVMGFESDLKGLAEPGP